MHNCKKENKNRFQLIFKREKLKKKKLKRISNRKNEGHFKIERKLKRKTWRLILRILLKRKDWLRSLNKVK